MYHGLYWSHRDDQKHMLKAFCFSLIRFRPCVHSVFIPDPPIKSFITLSSVSVKQMLPIDMWFRVKVDFHECQRMDTKISNVSSGILTLQAHLSLSSPPSSTVCSLLFQI